jgi:DNA gyrase/topoisomerase IV subunit A
MEIENVPVEQLIAECMEQYGTYVLEERQIPDFRDGLKPVQRRILWTMYEDNNRWNSRFTKCAATVGNAIARYHPHSDQSLYGALTKLAGLPIPKNKKIFYGPGAPYPLIEGYGNFGSIDGDNPAAMRYPEARLSYLAENLFRLITVGKTIPNYMNTRQEPLFLPSSVPFLLLNGASGIAVGTTMDIPPHNLKEVCAALKLCIKTDKPPSLKRILKHIKGPDWTYGGTIRDDKDMRDMYATGKGRVNWGLDTEVVKSGKTYQVLITGIPPRFNLPKFITKIGNKPGVKSVNKLDVSDTLKIVVSVNSASLAEGIADTNIPVTYAWNVCTRKKDSVDFMPTNLSSFLTMWVDYLLATQTLFFKKELRRIKDNMTVIQIKRMAAKHLKQVIAGIQDEDDAKLKKVLKTDEEGIGIVKGMSLGSLSKASQKGLKKTYVKEKKEFVLTKSQLANIQDFLIDFFTEVSKFSRPRKTKVIKA